MKSSISDNSKYPKFCLSAYENDVIFNNFKNNNCYNEILEHVSVADGIKYIQEIKCKNKSLLSFIGKYKENDLYGNTVKYKFEEPFGYMSPTTIRYIKALYDLCDLFGDLTNKVIVEVGAGYGGQCKIISDAFKFEKYHLFDLDEVNLLINKYLSKLKVNNFETHNFNTIKELQSDLFISNYAFSECDKNIQDIYINNLIKTAKHGYMICNFISHIFNLTSYTKEQLIDELKKYHDISVIEEKPVTFNNNIVISW